MTPMPCKRLLFALDTTPDKIGGMESFAVELARQLKAEGWGLTIVFEKLPPSQAVAEYLLSPGNVDLDEHPHQVGMGWRDLQRFYRLLRRYRPTAVLYTLGGAVRWLPLLGLLTGAERTVYLDQTSRAAAAMSYRATRKVRMFMKPLFASACASRFIKSCSEQEGIVPAGRSVVIYNSIDTHRRHGPGAAFRARHGIPADRIVVLQVSWLVAEKGIELALGAARRAVEARSDLHFVFCGDGERREEYQRAAARLGLADRTTWTGQLQDLFAEGAFAAADIQIQCSQWQEAFCLAVAEGMTAALPIVASRIGGLPELVADGETGLLFDPRSEEQLVAAILRLAADEGLRKQMGDAGRRRAAEWLDVVPSAAKFVRLLVDGERPVEA